MTILRTAFFEANLSAEEKEDFYQYMQQVVAPIINTFPHNQGVVLSKPEFIESEAHQEVLLIMQHSYANKALMQQALDSEQRIQSMNATKKIIEKYNIRVHHMNLIQD
ncbi:hypothetical protein MT391_14310 [Vibrio sp. 1-Bac 57]|uniref:hypothetical protein n=1 Tax=uncultured Psychromonas sp. TaxID=173974 RepID=UPI00260589A5|nr:hypothetical protein [uncultured Psychromonas sp.]